MRVLPGGTLAIHTGAHWRTCAVMLCHTLSLSRKHTNGSTVLYHSHWSYCLQELGKGSPTTNLWVPLGSIEGILLAGNR